LLAGLFFTSLASAIASGLSDEESDREGGKRTFTTALGNSAARNLSLASLALGGAFWFAAHLDGTLPRITAIPLLTLIAFGLQAQGRSAAAITGAFSAQASFKQALHRAIWGSTFAWALLIALTGFPS
jgi:1,4-dihydroxy-2-naphthoate octaprenyltransferase/chlorophyll synthase